MVAIGSEGEMDQVLSARLDGAVVLEVGRLARRLKTTKKAVLEQAIREYAARVAPDDDLDPLDVTCGAWARDEAPEATVQEARRRFRDSLARRRR
jgi:hypothetical protein